MSLADYESALPKLFPRDDNPPEPGLSEPQAMDPDTAQFRGFADIVEHHSETPGGRKVEIIPTSRFLPSQTKKSKERKYDDYAVVLRRTWIQQREASFLVRFELEIQSETLCKAFKKIVQNTYDGTDLLTFPIKIQSPFSELFFYREEIKELAKDDDTSSGLRREAQLLHDFIEENGLLSSIIQDHHRYSKEGRVVNDIMWTIYPPNSLIVVKVGMIRECWICRNVKAIYGSQGDSYWEVSGLRIGFDGSSPGLARQTFRLPFTGMHVTKISDLHVVPIEQCQDWNLLKPKLIARAKTLHNVLDSNFLSFKPQNYTGAAWKKAFNHYGPDVNPSLHAKQIDERVVVDFKAFTDYHQDTIPTLEDSRHILNKSKSKKGKTKAHRRPLYRDSESESEDEVTELQFDNDIMVFGANKNYQEEKDSVETELSNLLGLSKAVMDSFNVPKEDFDLLFPALIPAFGLQEKAWRWLLSDELRDVKWNDFAFQSLQLDSNTKHLVQSLLKGHKIKSASFDDVIPGKGQGLIFLLHGEPGLGKTLTAESISDYLERPLYSISGGELGTKVSNLEERLDMIFDLVKRWEAVSLLDEADVLLCKRTSAEIGRNAIVAVFLRKIEYFQGVLFLTTNRKEAFDEAFKSRINITITFPALSEVAQAAIWKNLIGANNTITLDNSWTQDVISTLGKLGLNGRTIKNTLRTAVAFAQANKEDLGARHVLAILRTELKEEDDAAKITNLAEPKNREIIVNESLRKLQLLVEAPYDQC